MNLIIKLGVVAVFVSSLFISCNKGDASGSGGQSPENQQQKSSETIEQGGEGAPSATQQGTNPQNPANALPTVGEPLQTSPDGINASETSRYTSFTLNSIDVEILFFEEDVITLYQNIGEDRYLIWLIDNDEAWYAWFTDFSQHVRAVIKRIYLSSINGFDGVKALVCEGKDTKARKRFFFERAIDRGTLIEADIYGTIYRYGKAIEGRISDTSDLRGHYISSVSFRNNTLAHIVLSALGQRKSLSRVNVPKKLSRGEFEVELERVNLEEYNNHLKSLWDDGNFSLCDVNDTAEPPEQQPLEQPPEQLPEEQPLEQQPEEVS